MCHKCVKCDISDRFQTVFQIKYWQFSDTFIKSDTFLMHFQIFSDIVLTDICIWQFSDIILTHLWLFSDTFLQLTVFWQISDRYLTVFWNFWDLHRHWVPNFYLNIFTISKIEFLTTWHINSRLGGRSITQFNIWFSF